MEINSMSTRSIIARANEDGSVDAIYCHWDGYPTNNGRLLLNHWADTRKVNALLSLGSLSSLGEVAGIKHPFDFATKHKYGTPAYTKYQRMCTAYGRDRGEKDQQATRYSTLDALAQEFDNYGAEYLYIWNVSESKWYWCKVRYNLAQMPELSELLPEHVAEKATA